MVHDAPAEVVSSLQRELDALEIVRVLETNACRTRLMAVESDVDLELRREQRLGREALQLLEVAPEATGVRP